MAKPFACLFPGQGAQFVGMGRDLYEGFPLVRDTFTSAEEILGSPLARLCFDGPEETLAATRNTQPAIFTLSVATWRLLRQAGLQPSATAGHSVGEYSALVCAAALDFEQGLRLVRLRGELMEQACTSQPGTMSAILGLDDDQIHDVCTSTGATAANFNCPGQVVISGPTDVVAKAAEVARERGGKVIPLAVGGAFHSPLMEPARERLAAALGPADISRAAIPVYCNVDALPHQEPDDLRLALGRQVTAGVLWKQSLLNMSGNGGINCFVEVGSEKVLSGMVKRTIRQAEIVSVWNSASLEAALVRMRGN